MEKQLVSTWESVTKNAEGEAEVHTLHKYEFKPEVPADLESLFVQRAPEAKVIKAKRRKVGKKVVEKMTMFAGDAQIPFHDPKAMELFLTAVREKQPDNVVLLGDMLDLPSLSRYEQRPEWVGTVQEAIDTYYEFLANIRAEAGNADIYAVHGNHEQRMVSYVQKNAAEMLGLKRAKMPEELSVLSIPYLSRYQDLEVQAIDGYPNGTLWLEDNLKAVHGTHTKSGGLNAAKYLSTEAESTLFGHTHRIERATKTRATRLGSTAVTAASPGALCLTDGTVPGFHHTMDAQGQVVKKAEDWQQGVGVVYHEGLHHEVQLFEITERGMIIDGKRFTADS